LPPAALAIGDLTQAYRDRAGVLSGVRPDGTFGFKEFRRDPEDAGHSTLVGDFSRLVYPTKDDALEAAIENVSWFAAINHKT
jgi:hypothetical protein